MALLLTLVIALAQARAGADMAEAPPAPWSLGLPPRLELAALPDLLDAHAPVTIESWPEVERLHDAYVERYDRLYARFIERPFRERGSEAFRAEFPSAREAAARELAGCEAAFFESLRGIVPEEGHVGLDRIKRRRAAARFDWASHGGAPGADRSDGPRGPAFCWADLSTLVFADEALRAHAEDLAPVLEPHEVARARELPSLFEGVDDAFIRWGNAMRTIRADAESAGEAMRDGDVRALAAERAASFAQPVVERFREVLRQQRRALWTMAAALPPAERAHLVDLLLLFWYRWSSDEPPAERVAGRAARMMADPRLTVEQRAEAERISEEWWLAERAAVEEWMDFFDDEESLWVLRPPRDLAERSRHLEGIKSRRAAAARSAEARLRAVLGAAKMTEDEGAGATGDASMERGRQALAHVPQAGLPPAPAPGTVLQALTDGDEAALRIEALCRDLEALRSACEARRLFPGRPVNLVVVAFSCLTGRDADWLAPALDEATASLGEAVREARARLAASEAALEEWQLAVDQADGRDPEAPARYYRSLAESESALRKVELITLLACARLASAISETEAAVLRRVTLRAMDEQWMQFVPSLEATLAAAEASAAADADADVLALLVQTEGDLLPRYESRFDDLVCARVGGFVPGMGPEPVSWDNAMSMHRNDVDRAVRVAAAVYPLRREAQRILVRVRVALGRERAGMLPGYAALAEMYFAPDMTWAYR